MALEANDSPASWGAAARWIALGVLAGVGAMLLTGMPKGSQEDLFIFPALTSVVAGAGGALTGLLGLSLGRRLRAQAVNREGWR